MSRLAAQMSSENVDDFWQIGKQVKIHTVPRSTLGGKNLDPTTGKAAQYNEKAFVPPYKRHARRNNPSQTSYAQYYQDLERDELTRTAGQMAPEGVDDDTASTTTGGMEHIDSLSMTTGLTDSTATVLLPEGKTEEEANQVYSHYNFRHTYDESLAITKYRKQIIATVESNPVTVIQGQTGSGKTTQVPQYILDNYAQNNRYCNIVVTQPRRIAAMSIAGRICHERGWDLGKVCGYQVGMKRETSEETRLLYCTTGVLLQKLICQKNMQDYTHVILDEVHERDQETDFTLLVVKKLLRSNSRDVKVILMSATIDSELFANYFSVHVRQSLEPAPILEVEGSSYTVQEYYLEDLKKLGEIPIVDPTQPKVEPQLYDIVKSLIMHFDNMEIQQYGKEVRGLSTKRGSVLCFLPGLFEINEMYDKLKPEEDVHKLRLLPLHSTITREEQGRVFDKPAPGQRKVILSTNIAESSITVPDIKYVIDFCLTKNLLADAETGYTSLQLQWASRANSTQRKGRAGRVSDGRVYRLVTRSFYQEFVPEYSTPEMQRCPLDIVVLKVKRLDLGEPKAILGLALSPPGLDDIECTILMLKEVGALASLESGECNPHDGKLTFLGRVIADLPLDIRLGKLILLGHVFGLLDECIIISACLSIKSFFSTPYKSYLEAYKKKFEWASESYSDCLAYLHAYKTWIQQKERGRFPTAKDEVQWARDMYIQLRRIRDVSELVVELQKRLHNVNIQSARGPTVRQTDIHTPQNQLILKVVLCGAFYPNYFSMGHLNEEEATKQIAGHNPYASVMVRGLPANQGHLYKKKVAQLFARCDGRQQLPKVHCEETKAFIEFPTDPTEESNLKLLPALYMALKMRQLRIPLEITPLDPESARQKMEHLSILQDTASITSKALRSNRFMNPEVVKDEEGFQDITEQVLLPQPTISTFMLCPTHVNDCGLFWAHYGDDETTRKLHELQDVINRYQGKNLKPLPPHERQQGSLCLAPYVDEGEGGVVQYYRARIEKLTGQQQLAHVFFVDYGNVEKVHYHQLRQLESHFRQYPLQAFQVQLCGIKPSPVKCPNNRWTREAHQRFKEILGRSAHHCYATVYSIVHGVIRADVYLSTGQPNVNLNVNQKLIDLCYADRAEEDFISKQNHRQREDESLGSPPAKPLGGLRRDLDGPLTLFGNSSPGNIDTSTTTFIRKSGGKITLVGPSSPYEMDFYSLTNIGRLRSCKIDRESMNSVALDDEPHTKHNRLMVAAYVGLNPSGRIMMCRDTTLMPSIPGLPALIAMLFTPSMELRVDHGLKRYIGVLCGLGWDPETGGPALGDHDMEITFDTHCDVDDIADINNVRMAINLAIGGDNTSSEWGQDMVMEIQRRTREKLLHLFKRKREPVTPGLCHRPYQWNLVDPDLVVRPAVESQLLESSNLFTLHNVIQLRVSDDDDTEEGDDSDQDQPRAVQQGATGTTRPKTPTRTDLLREMRMHVHWLHQQANRSSQPRTMTCNLCNVVTDTPRALMLHLKTSRHIQEEATLQLQQ